MSQQTLSRRRFLQVSGSVVAGGALATCAPLSASASRARGTPTTLSFWIPGGGGSYCSEFDIIGRHFTQAHPNLRLGPTMCSTGQNDFNTVLLAHIAAGNPPDAALLWDTPLPLAARGALEQLDDLMAHSEYSKKQDWPAPALASCQYGGKTWALPMSAGTYGLLYNQAWFEKLGIPAGRGDLPKTWDEMRKLSKEFTRWKGNVLVSAGFIPMAAELTVMAYVWSALNGGQMYDAQKRTYTINAEPNVAMADYMLSWLNEEYKGDWNAVLKNGSQYWTQTDSPSAWTDGQIAMIQLGSWGMQGIDTPKVPKWNIGPFPVGPGGTRTLSGLWPTWLVIPTGSRQSQGGFTWLDYLANKGMPLFYAVSPDVPANKLVPTDLVPPVLVQKHGKAFALDIVHYYHYLLDISLPVWTSPIQAFATDQIVRALDRVMYKAAKPKAALDEAQQACQNQMKTVQQPL